MEPYQEFEDFHQTPVRNDKGRRSRTPPGSSRSPFSNVAIQASTAKKISLSPLPQTIAPRLITATTSDCDTNKGNFDIRLQELQDRLSESIDAYERIDLYDAMGRLCWQEGDEMRQAVIYFTKQLELVQQQQRQAQQDFSSLQSQKQGEPSRSQFSLILQLWSAQILYNLAEVYRTGLEDAKMALRKYSKALSVLYQTFGECHHQITEEGACPDCGSKDPRRHPRSFHNREDKENEGVTVICEFHKKLGQELATLIQRVKEGQQELQKQPQTERGRPKIRQQLRDRQNRPVRSPPRPTRIVRAPSPLLTAKVDSSPRHSPVPRQQTALSRSPRTASSTENISPVPSPFVSTPATFDMPILSSNSFAFETKFERNESFAPDHSPLPNLDNQPRSTLIRASPTESKLPHASTTAILSPIRTKYNTRKQDELSEAISRTPKSSFASTPSTIGTRSTKSPTDSAPSSVNKGEIGFEILPQAHDPSGNKDFLDPSYRSVQTRFTNTTTASGSPSSSTVATKRNAPSRIIVLVWILIGLELLLDLVTSGIAVISLTEEFTCCGETIDYKAHGAKLMGIIIPFFLLVYVEVVVLALSIKAYLAMTPRQREREATKRRELHENVCLGFLGSTVRQRLINFLLTFNPFFGFMVAYLLLYQSNELECWLVLGLEGGSFLLHWFSMWLEGLPLSNFAIFWHSIPIIPFLVTIFLILNYLDRGGVCYYLQDAYFWIEGCRVCPDGSIPGDDGLCIDGSMGSFGDYCPNLLGDDSTAIVEDGVDESFCFFGISQNKTDFVGIFKGG